MIATDYGARFAGRAYPYYGGPTGGPFEAWDPRFAPRPGFAWMPFPGMAMQSFNATPQFAPAYPFAGPVPDSHIVQEGTEQLGPLDDEAIRELIYQCIDMDSTILPDVDIEIDVSQGVVTLKGQVPGKRTKRALGEAAWWIPAVNDVNNQLQVSPKRQRRQQGSAVRGAA